MLARLRRTLLVSIVNAAKRGQPLARSLVARETRKAYEAIPQTSPIVQGQFLIPDPSAPAIYDEDEDMEIAQRVALRPEPVTANALEGLVVQDVSTTLGSYGMGSYFFFGMLLEDRWMVIPITSAAQWIALDGRIVEDLTGETSDPWIKEGDDRALIKRLRGARITLAEIGQKSFRFVFDNGGTLALSEDPDDRPRYPGNGRARAFMPRDNLQDALFFSPSGELYL